MGWLNDRLGINKNNIGSIAALALPGVGGAVGGLGLLGQIANTVLGKKGGLTKDSGQDLLGLISGFQNLAGGKKAEGNANRLMGLQEGALNNSLGLQQQLMSGLGGLAGGILPAYQDFMANPLDPTKGTYRGLLESAGRQGNNAVDSIMNDYASRGLLGPNSGLAGAISNARFNTQSQAFQAAHQAALQGRQQRGAELQSGLNSLSPLYSMATNTNIANSLGGLAGMYQSKSDAFGDALGNLGGLLGRRAATGATTGTRGATAGQGLLNTNNVTGWGEGAANGSNPWASQSTAPATSRKRRLGGLL